MGWLFTFHPACPVCVISVRVRLRRAVGTVLSLVLQAIGAEVEQEADLNMGGGEVVDELDFMGGRQPLDGLVLDQNRVFNEHVGDEVSDKNAIVNDLKPLLNLCLKATLR
jgi:hypothetical protein